MPALQSRVCDCSLAGAAVDKDLAAYKHITFCLPALKMGAFGALSFRHSQGAGPHVSAPGCARGPAQRL